MGHTRFEDLKDLKAELDQLRAWDGIVERKPGIFYFKAIPFLHFHDKDGERWADVKTAAGWKHVPVSPPSTRESRRTFLSAVRAAHAALAVSKTSARGTTKKQKRA